MFVRQSPAFNRVERNSQHEEEARGRGGVEGIQGASGLNPHFHEVKAHLIQERNVVTVLGPGDKQ